MLKQVTKFMVIMLVLVLLVPAATAVLAAPDHQAVTCEEDYNVQADDWLSKLADKFYGDVLAYSAIFDATNAVAQSDDTYATIANPDLIEVGWKLCIPSLDDAQAMLGNEMMAESPAPVPLRVAMLIPGKIDDGGFMEAGYNGLLSIEQELSAEISYIDQIQPEPELLAAALRELAQQNPDLVIAHGGQNSAAAAEVAQEFPNVRFVVVQGNVTGDNLSSYEILQEQSAWLAGAAAGLLTESNVVGHISGIQVTPGLKGRAAFAHGLRTTNPEARFLTTFSGSQDDADLAKQVALAQINEGADIIFTMLNAARTGAIEANKETGTFQMGNVRDWYEVEPEVFVASALANVSKAGLRAAQDVASGNWQPGTIVKIGVEDPDAVSLALAPTVPVEVVEQVNALAEQIKSGEIEVSTEYEGEEFEVAP